MPSSWITKSDATEVRLANPINRDGMADGERERVYDLINDPRFKDADKTKVALVLKDLLQVDLTLRVKLKDLPSGGEEEEPTKTVDPEPEFGERLFWEGKGGNKEVVARSTIVESCVWDGERYAFTLRRAR